MWYIIIVPCEADRLSTQAWSSDKNGFGFPLEATEHTIWNLSCYASDLKRHFLDDGKQEKPDYPSLLSAVSKTGGRELKWTPVSPMEQVMELGVKEAGVSKA